MLDKLSSYPRPEIDSVRGLNKCSSYQFTQLVFATFSSGLESSVCIVTMLKECSPASLLPRDCSIRRSLKTCKNNNDIHCELFAFQPATVTLNLRICIQNRCFYCGYKVIYIRRVQYNDSVSLWID